MSSIGSRLKSSREKKGLLQSDLAKLIGVKSAAVISNWEKDINKPNADKMVEICQALDISLSYLLNYYGAEKAPSYSDEAMELAGDYDKMDRHGRKIVRLIADIELERLQTEIVGKVQPLEEERIVRFSVPGYSTPMSAGHGQEAGQEYPEDYTLVKAPPRGTSFIARVSGESMSPTYNDGDLVFVHACEEVPVGKIGVFLMDGQQYIKERGRDALISHNPDQETYYPRPYVEGTRCQGLVLGVCDESYLEKTSVTGGRFT